jgi:two-component system chemotaxis sensor kinase CheA
MSDAENSDLMDDFIQEAQEMIDEVEPIIIGASVVNREIAEILFRPIHSIKGGAGFLGLNNLLNVLHVCESLLTLCRESNDQDSTLNFDTSIIIDVLDFTREVINSSDVHNGDSGFLKKADSLKTKLDSLLAEHEKLPLSDMETFDSQHEKSELIVFDNDDTMLSEESIINEFIQKTMELLIRCENILISIVGGMSKEEDERELCQNLHTIKGDSGAIGFNTLSHVIHQIESVLEIIFEQRDLLAHDGVSEYVIFLVDMIREAIQVLKSKNSFNAWDCKEYITLNDQFKEKYQNSDNVDHKQLDTSFEIENQESLEKNQIIQESSRKGKKEELSIKQKVNSKKANKNIRIDLHKLDILNDLVGELLIAKTMLQKDLDSVTKESEAVEKSLHFLDKVVGELQDVSVSMRMVPVGSVLNRITRIIHDLSKKTGKAVNFSYKGEDTEVDKSIIEYLNDPLLHIVRNAVDHGLEANDERERKGKSYKGNIQVEAKQEQGEIWIVIQDDGKGLDREKILQKAIENGVIDADIGELTDKQVYECILKPGFSTAEQVSDISGRGVGLDVVQQNLNKIKGTIEIDSKQGVGTTFTLRIPLTLAIVEGMLVSSGNVKYIIPIESIRETLKISRDEFHSILSPDPVIKIRGELIQVNDISQTLYPENSQERQLDDVIVIVIESRSRCVAVTVEQLFGQCQTIIKSLPDYFGNNIMGVAGCSIQGNGEISLILDVSTFFQLITTQEAA